MNRFCPLEIISDSFCPLKIISVYFRSFYTVNTQNLKESEIISKRQKESEIISKGQKRFTQGFLEINVVRFARKNDTFSAVFLNTVTIDFSVPLGETSIDFYESLPAALAPPITSSKGE